MNILLCRIIWIANLIQNRHVVASSFFFCVCVCWFKVDSNPSFDRKVYHRQFTYDDAQAVGELFPVQFTGISENEQISSSAIVGENCSQKFALNTTTLSVGNIESLTPGRCEFVIVIGILEYQLTASVVVDIYSPGKS